MRRTSDYDDKQSLFDTFELLVASLFSQFVALSWIIGANLNMQITFSFLFWWHSSREDQRCHVSQLLSSFHPIIFFFPFAWPFASSSFRLLCKSPPWLNFFSRLSAPRAPLPLAAKSGVSNTDSVQLRQAGWRCNLISKSGDKLPRN